MKTVNRSAFVVRFKEPYVQWAAGLDSADSAIAEDLRKYASVYLVPEDPRGEEETASLADYFGTIFELELEAWCVDETMWPSVRDMDTFEEWFEVTGESVVIDLATSKLRSEELLGSPAHGIARRLLGRRMKISSSAFVEVGVDSTEWDGWHAKEEPQQAALTVSKNRRF